MLDIKVDLLQWFLNFLRKSTSRGAIKSGIIPNQGLVEELHKAIIRKFEKHKVCSCFNDNIWVLIFLMCK